MRHRFELDSLPPDREKGFKSPCGIEKKLAKDTVRNSFGRYIHQLSTYILIGAQLTHLFKNLPSRGLCKALHMYQTITCPCVAAFCTLPINSHPEIIIHSCTRRGGPLMCRWEEACLNSLSLCLSRSPLHFFARPHPKIAS